MATNFGKREWKLVAKGEHRSKAVNFANELSTHAPHRWIPALQLSTTGHATITERQALWLHFAWKRHSIEADFEPVSLAEQAKV
jgi:hypothetical protein